LYGAEILGSLNVMMLRLTGSGMIKSSIMLSPQRKSHDRNSSIRIRLGRMTFPGPWVHTPRANYQPTATPAYGRCWPKHRDRFCPNPIDPTAADHGRF
jgi:hypothetical protein